MFYVYLGLVGALIAIVVRNLYEEKSIMQQISYALLLVPLVLRLLVIK